LGLNQRIKLAKELENLLRRYGVEGEDAFYLLLYKYIELLDIKDLITDLDRILIKGLHALEKVNNREHINHFINVAISSDRKGENLPLWYQYFVGRRFREGSGKFFTPYIIARAMAALIPCKQNAVIMDPTCGGGTFLIEASKQWGMINCHLIANDLETSLMDLTRVVLILGTPVNHKKTFINANIYEPNYELKLLYGQVDYILANPPFSLRINDTKTYSKLYSLGYNNSDALFIDFSYKLLKPKGRLVCLLPHSIVANQEYNALRLAVEESWNLLAVISLPEGVFHLTANTTTRVDILILEKQSTSESPVSSKTIFACAPSVGIPLTRRAEGNEINYLDDIVKSHEVIETLRLK
jgi:type I restriction-modification system DNA methylase subunit